MSIEEFNQHKAKLKDQYEESMNLLIKEYTKDKCPYKEGDVLQTFSNETVKITKIYPGVDYKATPIFAYGGINVETGNETKVFPSQIKTK